MKVLQIGSFDVPWTTEWELRRALGANAIDVVAVSERDCDWNALAAIAQVQQVDWCLWTTTYSNAPEATYPQQRVFLAQMRDAGIPVAAYHLDLWWGLKEHGREDRVLHAPFFRADLVCTADGGHDADWQRVGVNHRWFPPGVSEFECVPGTPRDEYRSEIAFVGSHSPEYHRESRHRHELVRWLRETYGERVRFWPRAGEPGIRGKDLRDLYASCDVVVGDSCLVGDGARRYCSDRVPETLGRGAFLLHPYVEDVIPGLWEPFVHLGAWHAYDWAELRVQIDCMLDDPGMRETVAAAGRLHTLSEHSYTRRMAQLVDVLRAEAMLG